jgi:hypothetical protein
MASPEIVPNLDSALRARLHPAITRWNRLEGRPRTHDFDRALKAEVRDALWMLSRQWQTGEFRGEDAGSPVMARMCIDTAVIDGFQADGGAVEPLDLQQPLEARVERRALPLRVGAQYLSLDLRVAVGRRWLKRLKREFDAGGLTADYRPAYVNEYAVPVPDSTDLADALVCAHPDVWQEASMAAERAMDGIALLEYVAEAGHNAFDNVGADPADDARLAQMADDLQRWFSELILQPTDDTADAWIPSRLEYQFGCEATLAEGNSAMRAEEYYHGTLDWYALERMPSEARLGGEPAAEPHVVRDVKTFIPSSIVFEGMPNTRWWSFEDRRTNFGDVRPDTTDLGKLLLIEFALVYANDWFVFPYTLDVGTVTEVKGIALTDTFGERVWIEPIREQPVAEWQRWSIFTLGAATAERRPPHARLVLLPTVPKVQESNPLEQVAFIRDEMANMVWGIERRIVLPSGMAKPGGEAAQQLFAFLQRPLADELRRLQARRAALEAIPTADRTPAEDAELAAIVVRLAQILPPEPAAPIRYQAMNTVPEHWIPFIPVHVDGSVRETQLQRAAVLRILTGDPKPPEKIRPRTSLLCYGLPPAYFVHEEEVPRAGAVVTQSYQRTRWIDGKVVTWFGARKQTSRGEGWSGLAFDQIIPTK